MPIIYSDTFCIDPHLYYPRDIADGQERMDNKHLYHSPWHHSLNQRCQEYSGVCGNDNNVNN